MKRLGAVLRGSPFVVGLAASLMIAVAVFTTIDGNRGDGPAAGVGDGKRSPIRSVLEYDDYDPSSMPFAPELAEESGMSAAHPEFVVADASKADHNETDDCEVWEESSGEDQAIWDKPFDGTQTNHSIGFGGGVSGLAGGARRGAARRAAGDAEALRGRANAEEYDLPPENVFIVPNGRAALSTFAIDVDTASYANVRRIIERGGRPPKNAVRIEELVNAFTYSDLPPTDGKPFVVRAAVGACPWAPSHRLVRVAIKGRTVAAHQRPPANLVFLLDVSGSMNEPNKLPLAVRAMKLLVDRLEARDSIAIVTYADASRTALSPTRGSSKAEIYAALDELKAGGSTNGAGGIQQAYRLARETFIGEGMDRVVLCTDGDFNVGVVDRNELLDMIAKEAKSGVELTVLGFGYGNLKDATLEQLANRGNGNYGYVNDDREARKLLADATTGSFVTIAKDVKIQVEFNRAKVRGYRLLGYENRVMAAKEFRNDAKDAGEIGAGHLVTALYEVIPEGVDDGVGDPPLRYQSEIPETVVAAANVSNDVCAVSVRWKAPLSEEVSEATTTVDAGAAPTAAAEGDLRFASAVAMFGMLLRASPHRGASTWALLEELSLASAHEADAAVAEERAAFLALVRAARALHSG